MPVNIMPRYVTVSAKSTRLAVDRESDVAKHIQIEARRRNDDVGVQLFAGLQAGCRFAVKRSISSVTTVVLPVGIALNRSPSGMKAMRCRQGRYFGVKCLSTS